MDDSYLADQGFDVRAVDQCPTADLAPSQETLIEEAVDRALGNPQVVTCFLHGHDRPQFSVLFSGLHGHVAPVGVVSLDMDLSTRTEHYQIG